MRQPGHTQDAIAHFQRESELDPLDPEPAVKIASLLYKQSLSEQALPWCEEALHRAPGHVGALSIKAVVCEFLGKADAAFQAIRQLQQDKKLTVEAAVAFSKLAPRMHCLDEAQSELEQFLSTRSLRPAERELLLFALGDLLDRREQYAAAFGCYQAGNLARPHTFDTVRYERIIASIMQVMNPDLLTGMAQASRLNDMPIFIVGMPRSGTTLVEQILSSHTKVNGGGELEYMTELFAQAPAILDNHGTMHETLARARSEDLDRLAQYYLERIQPLAGNAAHVTDKLPGNFERLGLIVKLFPGARIIHCRRNPLDTCISCYFQNFGERHAYVHDLEALGKVYRQYDRLMSYWRDVVGIPMLEIQYEELVANQELQTRRLLEYCGLTWEAQCLDFHNSKRQTITASYNQVRRPMYNKSIERWRHYEEFLAPLRDGLGDLSR